MVLYKGVPKDCPEIDPKVSVVLCGYNQARYLRQAVLSVLNQTYLNIELVAIDNGSTDSSPAILQEFSADPRVRVIRHSENGAVTKRLNEGIRASSGRLISLLYADDYYLPHKIAMQVEAFASLGPEFGVVYSPGCIKNETTGELWTEDSLQCSGEVFEDLFRGYPKFLSTLSPLVRKECFERYPFCEDVFLQGENIFFWIAMRYHFYHCGTPCVVIRDRVDGSAKAVKRTSKIVHALLDRLEGHPDFPIWAHPLVSSFRGAVFRDYGWQGVRVAEDIEWSRDCYRIALHNAPSQILHPRVFVGLFLGMFPVPMIRLFNRALNAALRTRGNNSYLPDYR